MAKGRAAPKVKTMAGQIAKVSTQEGYGFLIDEENVERFFHASMMKEGHDFNSLQPGQLVRFSPLMSAKGARATMVEPVEDAKET